MVQVAHALRLGGYALGALGGALLFLEFFQLPSYVEYDTSFESYDVSVMPDEASEYTWAGRIGAFCLSLGFALLFVSEMVG